MSKPTSHQHIMQCINNVPLSNGGHAVKLNYLCKAVIANDHTGKQK